MPILATALLLLVLTSCQNDLIKDEVNQDLSLAISNTGFININLDQYHSATHLINPNELAAWESKKEVALLIIDLRSKKKYERGHLKNAYNLERLDYESKSYPYTGMRLEKEKMAEVLGALGASSEHRIVLYDDLGNTDAMRLWWILSLYGHSKTYVLNGGISNMESKLISSEQPKATSQIFEFKDAERPELLADKALFVKAMKDDSYLLLDCRTSEEFDGKVQKKGAFRKGHIPNSINIEHSESIAYERYLTFRDYHDLQERFESVPKDKNILVYCQSGVRSAHLTFVLRELLGYPNVANYDGSWIEWSYDKNLPVSTKTK